MKPPRTTCLYYRCDKPLAPGSTARCEEHLLMRRLEDRHRAEGTIGKWKPGKRGRPPLIRPEV